MTASLSGVCDWIGFRLPARRRLVYLSAVLASVLFTVLYAEPAEAQEPVEVQLSPGWNLVGWLEPAGEVGELYERLPGLQAILLAAPGARPWAGPDWRVVRPGDRGRVLPGDALWLKLAPGRPTIWRQRAATSIPSRPLRAGWHAVVWSWGADSWDGVEAVDRENRGGWEPFALGAWEAAAAAVTGGLREVRRWDAVDQRFESMSRRGAGSDELSTGPAIRRGEALLLRLETAAEWRVPSGAPVIGTRWMSLESEARLRAALSEAEAGFAAVLGLEPPSVVVQARTIGFGCLTGGGVGLVTLYLPCGAIPALVNDAVIQNYADTLVHEHERSGPSEPLWLAGGLAQYSAMRVRAERGRPRYEEARDVLVGLARSSPLPLTSTSFTGPSSRVGPLWYSSREPVREALWALAVDWLARGYGERALRAYVEHRRTLPWAEAFQASFSVSAPQMLANFGRYREWLSADGQFWAARPHHQIMFPGDMTEDRWRTFAEVEAIVDFFAERDGRVASSVTLMLDLPDAIYGQAEGAITPQSCGRAVGGLVTVSATCMFPFIVAHEYAHVLQHDERHSGRYSPQPRWLYEGAAEYLALNYSDHADPERAGAGLDHREGKAAEQVRQSSEGLTDLALAEQMLEELPYAAGALAVRHLVRWRGIDALWALFAPAWQGEFPAYFRAQTGLSLERFLDDFGGWLRTLAHPGASASEDDDP